MSLGSVPGGDQVEPSLMLEETEGKKKENNWEN